MSLIHRGKSASTNRNTNNLENGSSAADSCTIRKGSSDSPSQTNKYNNYNNTYTDDKYNKTTTTTDQQQSSSSTSSPPLTSPSRSHALHTGVKISTTTSASTTQKAQPLFRRTQSQVPPETPNWVYGTIVLFIIITFVTIPQPFHPEPGTVPTISHVFYYGWLTCISTGLGAIPFYLFPDVATFWIGVSNAVAAGMMVAASYSLFAEGCTYDDPHDSSEISAIVRTGIGAILGLGFILITKSFLDQYEDIKIGGVGGADARKALLIFFVMTLHSFSEGVGVGVSFGGVHGSELGIFISASLAVHNVPEGLAIAVALIARGLSITTAAVWAVATSLPQPLMAIPAYLFVNTFIPLLPVGLGFAGGAMAWVAFFELLVEAAEDTNIVTTILVSVPSFAVMIIAQQSLK